MDNVLVRFQHSFFQTHPWFPYTGKESHEKVIRHLMREEHMSQPYFGLTTKVRACKSAGQEWSSRVTFHAPGSVGKYEGMNPHTPKCAPTLGVGVLVDSQVFRRRLQGWKFIELKSSSYHWKSRETQMSKMGSYDQFGYLKHKLWPKKGPESNCQFDSRPLKVNNHPDLVACRWRAAYHWKALDEGYNFSLDLTSIKCLHKSYGPSKSRKSPFWKFRDSQLGSLKTKLHLGVGHVAMHKKYYKGEGGGFPQVQAVMSLMSLCLPVVRPCTKSAPTMH
jgi:hypothetical protein